MKNWMNWLLALAPLTVGLHYAMPEAHTLIFVISCAAIIPLAAWLGTATEHLAARTGEGVGGLLNATFGNAAELIIALVALRSGLFDVVKASLTGSIIGNILLVLGAAFLAGGLKHPAQRFNETAARMQSTMLTLAAIALIVPAAFHYLAGPQGYSREGSLSLEICVVLIVTYALGLLFSLRTHKSYFSGESGETAQHEGPVWPVGRSLALLAGATVAIAWISEILVASVGEAAAAFGMTSIFVGVIVVAIVGNAAEHSTAILAAAKNRMDLSLGIAMGSSIQVALFVAPVLVFLSYVVAPRPMDLVFTPAEVLAIGFSVLIMGQIADDGESNWIEGVQLLAVYVILGLVFYFLPETGTTAAGH